MSSVRGNGRPGRSKSSGRWLREHFDDPYVKEAQKQGLRSRSAFKLIEIDDRYRLIRPGMNVVDLGAAPGGWTQVVAKRLGGRGRVFALDILPMDPVGDAEVILGDFREESVLAQLNQRLHGTPIDLVISDMAPNFSGQEAVDLPRSLHLVELAVEFADQTLGPGGSLLFKLFQGPGSDDVLKRLRLCYEGVRVIKPKASRPRSREVYVVAAGRRL